jgi:translation initiation factor 1
MNKNTNSRLVYSSDSGRLCPNCSKPIAHCICKKMTVAQGDGVVRIRRETKGRGGKTVTVITGVLRDEAALKQMTTKLKQLCGTGGTLKDGIIEIQGDHRDKIQAELIKQGFTVKLSGG